MKTLKEKFLDKEILVEINTPLADRKAVEIKLEELGMTPFSYDTLKGILIGAYSSDKYQRYYTNKDSLPVIDINDFIQTLQIENSKGGVKVNKSSEIYTTQMMSKMGIERIIHNGPATIVFLLNGEKGVSVQSNDDHPDRVVGVAVAYAYAMGTNGNKTQFKKNVAKMDKHGGFSTKGGK